MISPEDQEIVAEFVTESRERLGDIENRILAIEAAGPDADAELVNDVFRAVHSIKGAAGFLGFQTLGHLAHHLESVLNLIRNRELVPDAQVTDILLRSADALKRMLDDIERSNEVDITEYVDLLQKIVDGLLQAEGATPGRDSVAPVAAVLPETAATPAVERVQEVQDSSIDPEIATMEATATVEPDLTASLEAEPRCEETAEPAMAHPEPPAVPHPAAPPTPPAAKASAPAASGRAAPAVETSIRVAVPVLDRLMNLAGELVLARNQLLQTVNGGENAVLNSVSARVDQITSDLQETIMQTRLQVVGTVFGKFPRTVRDLSNTLGKQCQLEIEGQEVELDKSIIEAIGDPLTHLVRNAIDHGIESPEVRVRKGKNPVGTVGLRAFHQAGKVNIAVSDDGAGIDPDRIREKAVARGFLQADQAREMSDREVLQLIFRPAFSTAENVTEVSGRGVGMDVVKTNIERLGGTVSVDTQLGRGSTFIVKLPLTLAIVPSLIVRCQSRRFAIPQTNISELVRIKPADVAGRIQRVAGAEVLRLRGSLLPLVRLSTALGMQAADSPENSGAWNIIVLETGAFRYGLIVDGLHDSEEIVVKPLGRHLKGCTCLAGATILGDGAVALILDVGALATFCSLDVADEDAAARHAFAGDGAGEETQSVLLFQNDPQELFAIPMALIARLERIQSAQIDSVGGQRVLQYRGVSLPLLTLEDYVRARPSPETSSLYVVVYRVGPREVGLLANSIVDIRQIGTSLDTVMFREPGVMGSLILEGKTMRLLDLYELTAAAHPEWVEHLQAAPQQEATTAGILLAEDSEFFRRQVARSLEEAGFSVVACEDGLAAWNALDSEQSPIGLVVTDLEMPNLDGLALARRVKDDPRFRDLPVIAVTSLASEDDRRRGYEAGVDEYHVKLDREQLITSVRRFLKKSAATLSASANR